MKLKLTPSQRAYATHVAVVFAAAALAVVVPHLAGVHPDVPVDAALTAGLSAAGHYLLDAVGADTTAPPAH